MDQKNNQTPQKPDGKRPKGSIWLAIMVSAALILLISTLWNYVRNSNIIQTNFSQFMEEAEKNNLAEVEIHHDRVLYLTKEEAAKPAAQQKPCYTGLPNGDILVAIRLETKSHNNCDTYLCRSTDGGQTWSESKRLKYSKRLAPAGISPL